MKREIIPWEEMSTYGKILGWHRQVVRNAFDLPPGFDIVEFVGTGGHFVNALMLHFVMEQYKEIDKLREEEYERTTQNLL